MEEFSLAHVVLDSFCDAKVKQGIGFVRTCSWEISLVANACLVHGFLGELSNMIIVRDLEVERCDWRGRFCGHDLRNILKVPVNLLEGSEGLGLHVLPGLARPDGPVTLVKSIEHLCKNCCDKYSI